MPPHRPDVGVDVQLDKRRAYHSTVRKNESSWVVTKSKTIAQNVPSWGNGVERKLGDPRTRGTRNCGVLISVTGTRLVIWTRRRLGPWFRIRRSNVIIRGLGLRWSGRGETLEGNPTL